MCAWKLNSAGVKTWNGTRVDSLKPGARFRCISGSAWRYVRPHHYSGVFTCENLETGTRDDFAGCAEVDLMEETKT